MQEFFAYLTQVDSNVWLAPFVGVNLLMLGIDEQQVKQDDDEQQIWVNDTGQLI